MIEEIIVNEATTSILANVPAEGIYAVLLIAGCNLITMLLPTHIKGDKWYQKGYNIFSRILNMLALNIIKNKNKDAK